MGFGNGVAPAPETHSEGNGRVTFRVHPLIVTIVFSLLSLVVGMAIDSTRSSATLDTKVAVTSDQQKQMVTKDQFEQYQNDTKDHLDRIEKELDDIKKSIERRH